MFSNVKFNWENTLKIVNTEAAFAYVVCFGVEKPKSIQGMVLEGTRECFFSRKRKMKPLPLYCFLFCVTQEINIFLGDLVANQPTLAHSPP